MPYLLRGGPRDRQLVDDLPRGYRPVFDVPAVEREFLFDDVFTDSARWDPGDGPAPDAEDGSPPG